MQGGQGSGLGLWVSKGFVVTQYGTLTAASEGIGKGSTFIVELPAFASEAVCGVNEHQVSSDGSSAYVPVNQSDKSQDANESNDTTSPRATVLLKSRDDCVSIPAAVISIIILVDDAVTNRKVLGRLLKNNNYTCYEASNGQECLDMMKEAAHQYDLILMDYEMPVMNGPTATKILRELGYTLPIIGLTGNVLQEDNEIFMAHGTNAVLHKPLSVAKFNEVIAHLFV